MKIFEFLWADQHRRLFFVEMVLTGALLAELFFQAVLGYQIAKAGSVSALTALISSVDIFSDCFLGRLIAGWLTYATYNDYGTMLVHLLYVRLFIIVILSAVYYHPVSRDRFWQQGRQGLSVLFLAMLAVMLFCLVMAYQAIGAVNSAVAVKYIHWGSCLLLAGSAVLFVIYLVKLVWRGYSLYAFAKEPSAIV